MLAAKSLCRTNGIVKLGFVWRFVQFTRLRSTGGTGFTLFIKSPEVVILGIYRKIDKVVARKGEMTIRLMLPLSLSYDHRVIDGAMVARFMDHLRQILAQADELIK